MDVSVPSCSSTSAKKVKRHNLSIGERKMLKNVYAGIRARFPNLSVLDSAEMCADFTKVAQSTVFRILKEKDSDDEITKAKTLTKTGRRRIVLDDDVKNTIRRKVHSFFIRKEIPTIKNIETEMRNDESLPKISRDVLVRTLAEMKIKYVRRNRNSALIERDEIILWRRDYLRDIREYRRGGKKIYYLDETWLNQGHTVSKVWQDLTVTNARQAFIEGLSTGLKPPSGKGCRLIITHIGSDTGFVEGGLSVFQSRKTGDYHEDMNAGVFEKWFESILPRLEPGSVIVLDNASYHTRRAEPLPTSNWKKADIFNWLTSKNIHCCDKMLKPELVRIARQHKQAHTKFVVDEMAKERGHVILRLPPYHCELNPIELIWAQIKNEVARNNTTFKMADLKILFENAVSAVTAVSWSKCVQHVIKEEDKFWDLDPQIETIIEPLIITLGNDDSESDDVSNLSEDDFFSD